MSSESTKQLLNSYHDASQRLQAIGAERLECRDLHDRASTAARELVSRCLLSDEPSFLIYLLDELMVLTKILGQPVAAEHIRIAEHILSSHYSQYGTF